MVLSVLTASASTEGCSDVAAKQLNVPCFDCNMPHLLLVIAVINVCLLVAYK